MTRVALLVELSADQTDRLRTGIGDADLREDGSVADCEIAFGNPAPRELADARDLRWVQLESVGFGEYVDLDWTDIGARITLTNLAGFFSEAVAETALAGLLALARRIDTLVLAQSDGSWLGDPVRTRARTVAGSHVVMVGYGAINRRLADLLAPFSCRITPILSTTSLEQLDDSLASADIVVCTAPDTPATRDLFDTHRIGLMPDHAVFANFGRGSIVDETALSHALNAGQLGGAVLDVTREEPLSPDHPFWQCPNTLLTQHSGGGSHDELDRKIDVFLTNLSRYRRGEPLSGVVDIARGY
ncbi:MAG: D-2-hydroxyacid dehydrogenase [Roseibium album]|uniref:D-2-hydroxyacid dehydrogenase n=1 Tax=Roseibium album TaxID=311410 RepID=UPI0018CBCE18|nr:phosphoglycerate dehydrogenase-like enzyme [Labrenzia sp. EL_195]